MKIGDKVRFLNEVGGGEVIAFREKGIALVLDDNGFEIPMLEKELVVIETNHLNIPTPPKTAKPVSGVIPNRAAMADAEEQEEVDLAELPMTFRPRPTERKGGEELNVFLAFVPVNIKELSTTRFEAYLVNDTNFFFRFALLAGEDSQYDLLTEDVVQPNSKLFLAELSLSDLALWGKLLVQSFAYKEGKSFQPKSVGSIAVKVDGSKFFKVHTFRLSAFFTTPALLLDLYRDDRPMRKVVYDADQVVDAMQQKDQPARLLRPSPRKEKNGAWVVDLHATALLDTTAGLSPKEILDYQLRIFRETMDEFKKEKGHKIVFIHGKGNGILRNAVEQELRKRYRSCTYQDASFQEYGYGATLVTIR